MSRKIIHVDMDAFYASVELRDRPDLREKPVAVGGSPEGRGVITTSNYVARKFGVKSAMSTATALRLCPELILIRPDFSKYKRDSKKVRAILERFSNAIEPLSLDEAYLDVTGSEHMGGSATRIAEEIRRLVKEEVGITCSAGVAPNKFLAKIASDINKPDGIKVVKPGEVEAFMKTLPVEKIWGVGKVTAAKLKGKGFHTCGDLQKKSLGELTGLFGSWGASLYDYSRGIDDRPVKWDRTRKSLSVEETYFKDLSTLDEMLSKIPELYEDWNERMMRAGLADKIRGIVVKLKFHDFTSMTRERVFEGKYPTVAEFKVLLEEAFNQRPESVRPTRGGILVENTSGPTQAVLSRFRTLGVMPTIREQVLSADVSLTTLEGNGGYKCVSPNSPCSPFRLSRSCRAKNKRYRTVKFRTST
ncbi:MAG: DNA polymerase IV [Bdellovibrionota bacterium]